MSRVPSAGLNWGQVTVPDAGLPIDNVTTADVQELNCGTGVARACVAAKTKAR